VKRKKYAIIILSTFFLYRYISSEVIFHLNFDNTLEAASSAGVASPAKERNLEFTEGIQNKAAILSQQEDFLEYYTEGNIDPESGTIEFGVKAADWDFSSKGLKYFFTLPFENNIRLTIYKYKDDSIFYSLLNNPEKMEIRFGPFRNYKEINAAVWNHIACTWTKSKFEIYFNGKKSAEKILEKPLELTPAKSFFIGRDYVSGTARDGSVIYDELYIYNSVLNPQEIETRYNLRGEAPAAAGRTIPEKNTRPPRSPKSSSQSSTAKKSLSETIPAVQDYEIDKVLKLNTGNLNIEISGKNKWTIRSAALGSDIIGRPIGYYGFVVEKTQYKFIGSGHKEAGEEIVVDVSISTDGREGSVINDTQTAGREIVLTKKSIIENMELTSTLRMKDDYFIEERFFHITQSNFYARKIYAFLYCWSAESTEYAAETLSGKLIHGKFLNNKANVIKEDVKWTAQWYPDKNTVLLSLYPVITKGKDQRNFIVDIADYHKQYLQTHSDEVLPKGTKITYRIINTIFVPQGNWKESAVQKIMEIRKAEKITEHGTEPSAVKSLAAPVGKQSPVVKPGYQLTPPVPDDFPPIGKKDILIRSTTNKIIEAIDYKENISKTKVSVASGVGALEEHSAHVYKVVTNLTFILRCQEPVSILVSPKSWKINKGQVYTVTVSCMDPFSVEASENDRLFLQLPAVQNGTVCIEPIPGCNIIPDSSFETDSITSLPLWNTSIPSPASSVKITGAAARTGKNALEIKHSGSGSTGIQSSKSLDLEAGEEYIYSAYYRITNANYGSSVRYGIRIKSAQGKELSFRDFFINPPVLTEPTEWKRVYVRFAVPGNFTGAAVELDLLCEGAPFISLWDDVELSRAHQKVTQFEYQLPVTMKLSDDEQINAQIKKLAPATAEVIRKSGWPVLEINRVPAPNFHFASTRWTEQSYAAAGLMENAGVKVQYIPIWLNYHDSRNYGEPVWKGEGKYDFSVIEKKIRSQLQWAPDGKIVLDIIIWPYPEFGDQYPSEIWTEASGKRLLRGKEYPVEANSRPAGDVWVYSLSSEIFRQKAEEVFHQMGRYVSTLDSGKSVIGINMIAGGDGQWLSWKKRDMCTFDHSAGHLRSYRQWLKTRYKTDQELQRAWDNPGVTFDTAEIPKDAERAPDGKFFFDSGKNASITDAVLFMSEGVAETVCRLARAFKKGINRPSIASIYYPDTMSHSQGGHNALRYFLQSSDLDGIVSLVGYGATRDVGRTGGNVSVFSSLTLHNKIYIQEMDYRTQFANLWTDAHHFRKAFGVPMGSAWKDQLRRDLGYVLTKGQRGWIFDIGQSASLGPEATEGLKELVQVSLYAAQNPAAGDHGQIAVFADELVGIYGTRTDKWANLGEASHKSVRPAFLRSGLSWDPYELSDVDHTERPSYKLSIFLSAVSLTPQQIDWIQKNLQKDGNVLVFVNAAGYVHGEGFEKNIRTLTGMTIRTDMTTVNTWKLKPVESKEQLFVDDELPAYLLRGPLFYVDDPKAVPVAVIEGTDKTGAAYIRHKNWTAVYIATPGAFTPKMIRNLATMAGIKPVGPENDVTHCGNGITVIHALSSGQKLLQWNKKYTVTDFTSEKIMGENIDTLRLDMKAGETRWFKRVAGK